MGDPLDDLAIPRPEAPRLPLGKLKELVAATTKDVRMIRATISLAPQRKNGVTLTREYVRRANEAIASAMTSLQSITEILSQQHG